MTHHQINQEVIQSGDIVLAEETIINMLSLQEDVEAEMRRLKLELKQTMDMFSTACKEALTAKQKVKITNKKY